MTATPSQQPGEKKRKRRIAADEAHAWARNLRLRNSLGKLVLCMLTGYVNGEGVCFVGIEALAEDTELSADTVRKRLAWLEGVGVIARFPQWIDANGRRNGEGKGRRTSDEVRLLIDANPDAIEARAAGDEVSEDEVDPRCGMGVTEQGSEQADPGAGPALTPPLALCQPSDSGEGLSTNLNTEPESESSPPSVPHVVAGEGGEDSNDEEANATTDAIEGWQEFKREFEADGDTIVKSSLPMTLFAALNLEQRALLTKAARGLIYVRRQQNKNLKTPRPKPAPQTFIRETDSWDSWAAQAPPRPQDFHVISVESREAIAYRNLHRVGRGVAPIEAAGKYTLKRSLTAAELLFAELPSERSWGFVDQDNQIASWLAFFSNVLVGARRPLVESHIVTGDAKRGFFAPWPWPPSKDGRAIPWPPPDSQSSAA